MKNAVDALLMGVASAGFSVMLGQNVVTNAMCFIVTAIGTYVVFSRGREAQKK